MASTNDLTVDEDTFGQGVFDEPPTSQIGDDDNDTLELTDEAIAIAEADYDEFGGAAVQEEEEQQEPEEKLDDDDSNEEQEESEETEEENDDSEVNWSESDIRLASQYGLSQDDLDELPSVESLHTAIDVIERRESRQRTSGTKSETEADKDSSTTEIESVLKEIEDFEAIDLSKIELDKYGDEDRTVVESISQMQGLIKKVGSVLSQSQKDLADQREQVAEQQRAETRKQFNNHLDKHPELYGNSTGKRLSRVHADARKRVQKTVEVLARGYAGSDGEFPDLEQLFDEAIRAVDGGKLRKTEKTPPQERAAKLRNQSKKRRSPGTKAGARKRSPQPDSDEPEDIARDPELRALFDQFQTENGA